MEGHVIATQRNEKPTPGSIPEARHLYQTKPDNRGRTSWTTTLPDDLVQPVETLESKNYALLVRNVKSYNGLKSLEIHSIVVQSGMLKKFLANVMNGYPGLSMSLDRVEFKAPFKAFVHRWKQFCEARDNEPDGPTKTHVELLYRILDDQLHPTIARKDDLIKSGVITHDLLWAIFEPGCSILSVVDGRQRAFICNSGDYDCRTGEFEISTKYVDWNGKKFGHARHDLSISPYEGTLPIMELSAFPLLHHSGHQAVRENLVSRGKLWESYKGYHYKQYEGIAKARHLGCYRSFSIKGRIVIDTEAYNFFNPDEETSVSGLPTGELSDDDRFHATPILHGYSLKEKKWMRFFVDAVTDITWNTQAFDSLVLPHAQQDLKRLILGFARSQSSRQATFDDVIHGKGRGVIMLLKGPPGVGKTLTAESVAEVMKVPLYTLSAGDLGTNARNVEDALKNILTMIPRWGAIILLDEADVFMEARDTVNLQRNELVSTFLRLLEYYEGILFLTTNRAENIDPAFESRIHVSIGYPELTTPSRRQIWRQFISERNIKDFAETDLDHVASLELNGRQIKNVLKTAHLLAQEEGCGLNYDHVRTVLNLRADEKTGSVLV
ncbi:P-loop containing nucleoside triphosphate hydrolase protein [Aspergillus egyptiacus]|nr:P-loop containing nucleoside triphosphate hydrolase protein [Aspergillus egyptiacus]